MIYKLEREFLEFEKWCCAVTSDNSMLFAINTNREFFVLNQDVESYHLLSSFINHKCIALSWEKNLAVWCKKAFGIMPINMRMTNLVKKQNGQKASYKIACYRAGIEQVSLKGNIKNNCALEAQNLLKIYTDYLTEDVNMMIDLSREYRTDYLNTPASEIIETIPNLETAYNQPTMVFKYEPPLALKFETPQMNAILDEILSEPFIVKNGSLTHKALPKKFIVNGTEVTIGVGGIHGFNVRINGHSTADAILKDWDFGSYYPSLICTDQCLRRLLGEHFVTMYNKLREYRLSMKHVNPTLAKGLKLILNSAFGKTGFAYSRLYNPQVFIQITLTGQLYLLMILEMCEKYGLPVLSINTDGFTLIDDNNNFSTLIARHMESITGLTLEESVYEKYYGKDVNNYMTFKDNGKIKAIGSYSMNRDIGGSNNSLAINKMVLNVLKHGGEPKDYLKDCLPCDYLNIANCTATNEVIRFYRAKNCDLNPLRFANGRKVPKGDCCAIASDFEPLQAIVDNIDYEYYVNEAQNLLDKIVPATERPYDLKIQESIL